jgi:hypothetical protein
MFQPQIISYRSIEFIDSIGKIEPRENDNLFQEGYKTVARTVSSLFLFYVGGCVGTIYNSFGFLARLSLSFVSFFKFKQVCDCSAKEHFCKAIQHCINLVYDLAGVLIPEIGCLIYGLFPFYTNLLTKKIIFFPNIEVKPGEISVPEAPPVVLASAPAVKAPSPPSLVVAPPSLKDDAKRPKRKKVRVLKKRHKKPQKALKEKVITVEKVEAPPLPEKVREVKQKNLKPYCLSNLATKYVKGHEHDQNPISTRFLYFLSEFATAKLGATTLLGIKVGHGYSLTGVCVDIAQLAKEKFSGASGDMKKTWDNLAGHISNIVFEEIFYRVGDWTFAAIELPGLNIDVPVSLVQSTLFALAPDKYATLKLKLKSSLESLVVNNLFNWREKQT